MKCKQTRNRYAYNVCQYKPPGMDKQDDQNEQQQVIDLKKEERDNEFKRVVKHHISDGPDQPYRDFIGQVVVDQSPDINRGK